MSGDRTVARARWPSALRASWEQERAARRARALAGDCSPLGGIARTVALGPAGLTPVKRDGRAVGAHAARRYGRGSKTACVAKRERMGSGNARLAERPRQRVTCAAASAWRSNFEAADAT